MIKKEYIIGVRQTVLDCIAIMADKDFQQRIWIRGEGPEIHDVADLMCDFLPLCEEILEKYKEFGFSLSQKEMLSSLYLRTGHYNDNTQDMTDEEIVNDPKWDEICEYAKEVLKVLEKQP